MPRNDGRLEPGQPLSGAISARAWNRMMDASDIVHGDRYSVEATGASGVQPSYTWMYAQVLQSTPQWGAVEIYDTVDVVAFPSLIQTDRIIYKARLPASDDVPFGVAVEPIAAGSVGKIAVGGVVPAVLDDFQGKNEEHRTYARARANSFRLSCAAAGAARVVYAPGPVMNMQDPNAPAWDSYNGYPRFALIHLGSQLLELRGEFYGRWDKGTAKTINIIAEGWQNAGESVSAKNYIATIDASAARRCTIAFLNGEWQLTSYDLTNEPSYTALRRQYLSHDTSGCVTWSEAFVRARASGPWPYGGTISLRFYRDGILSNETVSATNNLISINATTTGSNAGYDVFLAYVDNEWTLIGFDYRKLSGYRDGQRKMLVAGGSGLEFLSPPAGSLLYFNDSGGIEVLTPPGFSTGGTYVLSASASQGPVWRKVDPSALL